MYRILTRTRADGRVLSASGDVAALDGGVSVEHVAGELEIGEAAFFGRVGNCFCANCMGSVRSSPDGLCGAEVASVFDANGVLRYACPTEWSGPSCPGSSFLSGVHALVDIPLWNSRFESARWGVWTCCTLNFEAE